VPPWDLSWQARCRIGAEGTRAEAKAFWLGLGFRASDLQWEEGGYLQVENVTTGYTPPLGGPVGAPFPGGYSECWTAEDIPEQGAVHATGAASDDTGRHWFNIVSSFGGMMPVFAGDGTEIPNDLIKEHYAKMWHSTYALKLQQGDLVFVDNLSVQHGRMPFVNSEGCKRSMMTLIYE
jgi:hypothetical protein